MPIKLNLLAEQIAAEDAKRRDPIKRSIALGIVLTAAFLLLIIWRQFTVRSAGQHFSGLTNRLTQIDEKFRLVKTNQAIWMDTEFRISSLNRFSSNKFLWGTFLNAVQECALPELRLTSLSGETTYHTNEPIKLLTTNLLAKYIPPPWKYNFWSEPRDPNYVGTVSNQFTTITNAGTFVTNVIKYTTKLIVADTNLITKMVVVKAEWATVPFSLEKITIQIKGRDYAARVGDALDQFGKRIKAHPYFKDLLQPGSLGYSITDIAPVPQTDPNDPVSPEARFVPFTIECKFKERILINE